MATSFLTAAQKEALNQVIDDIHETFARSVTVYKEASKVVIITDPNFNPLYNTGGQTTSIENTPEYRSFSVRILHLDDIRQPYGSENNVNTQVKLDAMVGGVRLKLHAEDYDYIKDARRFDVDGQRYLLNSSFRGHGLFDSQYYTIYLKPDP